jgi:hypothetical protein
LAELEITRKLRAYHSMYRLNLSFANIVAHCGALGEAGLLPQKYMRRYQAFAQELQAQINEEVADILLSIEGDDLYRFGKVRQAWEKEIRDPDDLFIEAEERRRELARQGKTPPPFKLPTKKKLQRKKASQLRRKP